MEFNTKLNKLIACRNFVTINAETFYNGLNVLYNYENIDYIVNDKGKVVLE